MLKTKVVNFIKRKFVCGDIHRNDRYGALYQAWGHVFTSQIRGDYIEFGVYKGESLVDSYRSYKQFVAWLNHQMKSNEPTRVEAAKAYVDFKHKFHGLDTFSGMPDNEEGDINFAKGSFPTSYDSVYNRCVRQGLSQGGNALHLYQGLFKDSEAKLRTNVQKAAIINIDCDLYESAKDALNISAPLIQIGTVLMFDEYNAFCADNRKGERRAFKEFQDKSSFKFEPWFPYHFVGQTFLCVG